MRVAAGIAAFLVAAPLLSQVSATVDVKVINVDVAVIDGAWRAVTDLQSRDFEVLEDGRLKRLTNFALINRHPGREASPVRGDLQLRRRVILLVDNNYLDRVDRRDALRALDEFIDTTFDGSYEWALGMIGQRLEIVQPFTADRKLIHDAIAKIRASATTTYRDLMDRSMLDDSLFQRSDLDVSAEFASRERTTRNAQSLANSARGLIDAARLFAPVEGKKLAVLMTGSMDLNTAFASFDTGSDRELADTRTTTAKLIDAIVHEANAANMSIHVLRIAGRQNAIPQHDVDNHSSGRGVEGINMTGESDVRDTSSVWTIAAGTGGLFLSSNSVRDSLDAINAVAASYYLLGYEPGHGDDRQYHRITVRVKRPSVRIAYRQGYLDLPAEERIERLLHLRISELQPATGVPVTLNVSNLSVVGKPAVSLLASMPMAGVTLLPKDGRYTGRVHVYLAIFDRNGRNVGFHHRVQDLSFSHVERDKAIADAFRYRMDVRLDKGEFTLAVTLRDDLSDDFGTAVERIHL